MTGERWREAYREAPEVFDAFSRAEDPDGRIAAAVLQHARPAGRDVVEIGCGTGRLARELARSARSYVGIEPAAAMLGLARRAAPAEARFVRGRGQDLPLRSGVADVLIAGWVFAFMRADTRERALSEARRALRPATNGGSGIWLIENHWDSEFQRVRGRLPDPANADVRPLLDAGFRVAATIDTQIRFDVPGECLRVVGYLCGDDAATRLRAAPRSRLEHRVVLLHRNA